MGLEPSITVGAVRRPGWAVTYPAQMPLDGVRLGIVLLPELRWTEQRERFEQAEAWGFDSAWTYDHLGWRSLVDGPWFGPLTTLAAAAAVTSRIRLGTFVASPNVRHPVPFAREVLALDDVSEGRLSLGIGAGGEGYDAAVMGAAGLTARQRVDRYGEFVELLDLLLTQERTTWSGSWYTAVEARSAPGCVQQPRVPFVLAANGPRSMRLVASRGQGWVTTGPATAGDEQEWWAGVAELSDHLDDALSEAGKSRDSVERYLSLDSGPAFGLGSVEHLRDCAGRAVDLGFDEVVVHWPRPDGVYASRLEVLAEAAELLGRSDGPRQWHATGF